MKVWLSCVATVLALVAVQSTFAGNNAAPLGVELGVATAIARWRIGMGP